MNERAFVGRTSWRIQAALSRHAVGDSAMAISPPAYGIDLIDGSLPRPLRAGFEALSGVSQSDVRVHANYLAHKKSKEIKAARAQADQRGQDQRQDQRGQAPMALP